MTEPTLRSAALSVFEAILFVAPGRFYRARRTLRAFVLSIPPAVLLWGIGYVAELGFGLSIPGLAAQRDQNILASVLLVIVTSAGYGSIFAYLSSVLDSPAAESPTAKHTDAPVSVAPAWWVAAVFTALSVSLGIIAWGGLYAAYQWMFKSRNLFVVNEIAFIVEFGLGVGVCVGVVVAAISGLSRLAKLMRPTFIVSPWLWALVCAVQWLWFTALLMFLCANLAFLVRMALLKFGLDAQITTATAVAGFLFSAAICSIGVVAVWSERSSSIDIKSAASLRQDFWDIDLKPETSRSGTAWTGYPFYIWRESADSRLGLSRPRYCVITDDGRELNFVFFDPSADRQRTWAVLSGVIVAVVVIVAMTSATWLSGGSPSIFGTTVLATLIGALAGGGWHLGLTLWRWKSGRFKRDGRFTMKPLRLLSGFNKVHAGEIGAKINGEQAKTGHGLTATFDDGSMIILTGNAWNFPSIVEHHSELTNAFRVPRDDYVAQWEAKQTKKTNGSVEPLAQGAGDAPKSRAAIVDVPERL